MYQVEHADIHTNLYCGQIIFIANNLMHFSFDEVKIRMSTQKCGHVDEWTRMICSRWYATLGFWFLPFGK